MKKKKKKVKIKWKNIIILLVFIFSIVFLSIKIPKLIINIFKDTPKQEEKKKQEKKKEEKKEEPVEDTKDQRLKELDNINERIDYFNNSYIDRYITYKNNNPNKEIERVIIEVNMNLDKEVYQDIIPAKNLNNEKVLVNKYYYLDENYVPENLEKINQNYALSGMSMVNVAKEAFESLAKSAKKEGLSIIAMSTYRSYNYQVNLYNRYVKQDGKEEADTYSGRPGHSEHQTGLAVDVYNGKEDYTNFEKTKEFNWMQEHAHEFGFILRFPKDKENETKYQYESWHYRYVGIDAAKYIHDKNISFEEYYATIIKDW